MNNKEIKSPNEVVVESSTGVQPTESKPKKRIGLVIMLVILGLLLVGGALALGYLWGNKNNQPQNNAFNSSTSEGRENPSIEPEVKNYTERLVDEEELVNEEDEVKNIVSKIYDAVKEAVAPSTLVYKVYDGNPVLYKDANMKVATSLDKSYGVAFPSLSDTSIKLGDIVKATIEGLGFVHYSDVASPTNDGNYINNEKQIICNGILNTTPFEVDCGKTSWISADKKAFIDNLAEATGDLNAKIIIADKTNVVDSSVSPYQTLTADVSNATGLFYRNNPNSEWKFFTITQMIIPCKSYLEHPDSENIVKAFADSTCYDAQTRVETKVGDYIK
ncbi:hypothetical protein IJG27_03705 [Candidatus Saccharibacteria bacterium]|nr:hypothetical protein [Candidatus Saccharibacteria bacterium]MBQ3467947.1 hypothetical protein [Candidatus Saccharibacteria bacterium]